MEIQGKVLRIGTEQQVSGNFKKRNLLLEYATNPQYPQKLAIEFVQDRTALLDKVKEGDEVTVYIDLRGSESKGRYFTNITGWRITTNAPSDQPALPGVSTPTNPPIDEIPF